MSGFRYRYHGDVVIAIHSQEQPGLKAWTTYLAKLKSHPPRAAIVWWDQWTPDLATRRDILKHAPARIPVAVISGDTAAKYAVEALNLFLANFKFFQPSGVEEAFRYVGLTSSECARVVQDLRWPVLDSTPQ